ncbi:MAG TPA: hypothetical protein VM575_17020 [Nocardioides sp.]|nr:hypothetical protein [Nocardioides sp.]
MAPPTWKRYRPDPTPDGESDGVAPRKVKGYQPPKQPKPVRSLEERTVRRTGPRLPVGLVIAGVAVVGVATTLVLVLAGGDDPEEQPQTDTGFDAMVSALREETGSTLARNVVVYPTYAVIDVPYKPAVPSDEREISYYWDGGLRESTKGTGDEAVFELTLVDASLLPGMCKQVRELVEDPGDCSLYISKPDPDDTTPEWIRASVSNEFGQSGTIEYALDGSVIETRPPS